MPSLTYHLGRIDFLAIPPIGSVCIDLFAFALQQEPHFA